MWHHLRHVLYLGLSCSRSSNMCASQAYLLIIRSILWMSVELEVRIGDAVCVVPT